MKNKFCKMKMFLIFVGLVIGFNATFSQSTKNSTHRLQTSSFIGIGTNLRFGGCDFLNMVTVEEVKAKTEERFWGKIKFGEQTECWVWIASLSKTGYGQYKDQLKVNHTTKSHRYMYARVFGEFDPLLDCLHECDNPTCVNPNHLWLGTAKDNADDMHRKGRHTQWDRHGEVNPSAKLRATDIPVIREKLKNNQTLASIAEIYGVTLQTISFIKRGKTWTTII